MRRTRVDVQPHPCHSPTQGRALLRLGSAGAHLRPVKPPHTRKGPASTRQSPTRTQAIASNRQLRLELPSAHVVVAPVDVTATSCGGPGRGTDAWARRFPVGRPLSGQASRLRNRKSEIRSLSGERAPFSRQISSLSRDLDGRLRRLITRVAPSRTVVSRRRCSAWTAQDRVEAGAHRLCDIRKRASR